MPAKNKVQINFSAPYFLMEKIEHEASLEKRSVSFFVNRAIEEKLYKDTFLEFKEGEEDEARLDFLQSYMDIIEREYPKRTGEVPEKHTVSVLRDINDIMNKDSESLSKITGKFFPKNTIILIALYRFFNE